MVVSAAPVYPTQPSPQHGGWQQTAILVLLLETTSTSIRSSRLASGISSSLGTSAHAGWVASTVQNATGTCTNKFQQNMTKYSQVQDRFWYKVRDLVLPSDMCLVCKWNLHVPSVLNRKCSISQVLDFSNFSKSISAPHI